MLTASSITAPHRGQDMRTEYFPPLSTSGSNIATLLIQGETSSADGLHRVRKDGETDLGQSASPTGRRALRPCLGRPVFCERPKISHRTPSKTKPWHGEV